MAVVRGSLGKFPVVLASATPSIESHVNALTGRYRHRRPSGPLLRRSSCRRSRRSICARTSRTRGSWLAPQLVDAVTETLANKQQSLLFLNRRGYAPLTLCRKCGQRIQCPQCTAWLVEHRFRKRLNCHHCGFSLSIPEKCPKCGEPGALVACGPGVERVAEEVAERFPEARLALLSSDLVPGLTEMREIIKKIEAGEIDIIIGTQIVAKGHHFPGLSLVGIVDGDLGLAQGADPRAAERTFQLLHQVTGRAGRTFAARQGLRADLYAGASGDGRRSSRATARRSSIAKSSSASGVCLPPYGRLAALVISARDKETAEVFARDIAHRAPRSDRIDVLGPAEAPIAIVRGRHRWRLLVKAPREMDVQGFLRAWLAELPKLPTDIRLTVDIDPYSFL